MRAARPLVLIATIALAASAHAAGPKKSRSRAAPRTPAAPAAPAAKPAQIVHSPPPEQTVLTPIPIWVETRDASVTRVVVRYKAFGAPTWTAMDLTKVETGWAGEIPCRDVGTVTGVFRYYVTAYDSEGNSIGAQGDIKRPNKVKIRRTIQSPAPHLPGRSPPMRCVDTTDCPPGFPGCTSKATRDNNCVVDDDCDEGMVCGSEGCEAPASKQKKNWLSFGIVQDVVILNSLDPCTADNQDSGEFACYRQDDGANYFGNPLPQKAKLSYGPTTTRLFIGYDRFLSSHFAFGLRGGYVVRGLAPALENRKQSLPVLAELRLAYWFNSDAAVRPHIYLSGGYSPFDVKFPAFVEEDTTLAPTQANPDSQTLDAWTTRGPWFGGIGLGIMFATSSSTGFVLGVEGASTFPRISTVVRPELSFAFGF